MTDTEEAVTHYNDVVTRVGGTYCVSMRGHYMTAIGAQREGQMGVTVHMDDDQVRALCAGLKDALHEASRVR